MPIESSEPLSTKPISLGEVKAIAAGLFAELESEDGVFYEPAPYANGSGLDVYRYNDNISEEKRYYCWHLCQMFVHNYQKISENLRVLVSRQGYWLRDLEFDNAVLSAGVVAERADFVEEYQAMHLRLKIIYSPQDEQETKITGEVFFELHILHDKSMHLELLEFYEIPDSYEGNSAQE